MSDAANGPLAQSFASLVRRAHRLLPGPLALIPLTFIGFALINSFTLGVDLILLWVSHIVLAFPYPVAVTTSFGLASVLAFFLNKVLNFRAHGDTATQSTKYLAVIVTNYAIWVLGFSSALEWLGVHYQVSRIMAALVEGAYIYLLSRFWVFPPRQGLRDVQPSPRSGEEPTRSVQRTAA